MWFNTAPAERAKWSKRNYYRFLDRWRDRWDLVLDPHPPQEHHHDGAHHVHDRRRLAARGRQSTVGIGGAGGSVEMRGSFAFGRGGLRRRGGSLVLGALVRPRGGRTSGSGMGFVPAA